MANLAVYMDNVRGERLMIKLQKKITIVIAMTK